MVAINSKREPDLRVCKAPGCRKFVKPKQYTDSAGYTRVETEKMVNRRKTCGRVCAAKLREQTRNELKEPLIYDLSAIDRFILRPAI